MPRGMVACKPCDRSAKAMNTTPSPVPPKHCADCVLRRKAAECLPSLLQVESQSVTMEEGA